MIQKYWKLEIVPWNEGTDELSLEQEGALLRICNAINLYDAPISSNPFVLCGLFRCNDRKAKRLLRELVDAGKVVVENGKVHNRKAAETVSNRVRIAAGKSSNGVRGGIESGKSRAKVLKTKEAPQANASTPNEQDKIREDKRREEKKEEPPIVPQNRKCIPKRIPDGLEPCAKVIPFAEKKEMCAEFDESFWPQYPRKVGKPTALASYLRARKAHSFETILAGVSRHISAWDESEVDIQFIPHPSTYLNQERFNDEPERQRPDRSREGNGTARLAGELQASGLFSCDFSFDTDTCEGEGRPHSLGTVELDYPDKGLWSPKGVR